MAENAAKPHGFEPFAGAKQPIATKMPVEERNADIGLEVGFGRDAVGLAGVGL
jgi:hypothetical protein